NNQHSSATHHQRAAVTFNTMREADKLRRKYRENRARKKEGEKKLFDRAKFWETFFLKTSTSASGGAAGGGVTARLSLAGQTMGSLGVIVAAALRKKTTVLINTPKTPGNIREHQMLELPLVAKSGTASYLQLEKRSTVSPAALISSLEYLDVLFRMSTGSLLACRNKESSKDTSRGDDGAHLNINNLTTSTSFAVIFVCKMLTGLREILKDSKNGTSCSTGGTLGTTTASAAGSPASAFVPLEQGVVTFLRWLLRDARTALWRLLQAQEDEKHIDSIFTHVFSGQQETSTDSDKTASMQKEAVDDVVKEREEKSRTTSGPVPDEAEQGDAVFSDAHHGADEEEKVHNLHHDFNEGTSRHAHAGSLNSLRRRSTHAAGTTTPDEDEGSSPANDRGVDKQGRNTGNYETTEVFQDVVTGVKEEDQDEDDDSSKYNTIAGGVADQVQPRKSMVGGSMKKISRRAGTRAHLALDVSGGTSLELLEKQKELRSSPANGYPTGGGGAPHHKRTITQEEHKRIRQEFQETVYQACIANWDVIRIVRKQRAWEQQQMAVQAIPGVGGTGRRRSLSHGGETRRRGSIFADRGDILELEESADGESLFHATSLETLSEDAHHIIPSVFGQIGEATDDVDHKEIDVGGGGVDDSPTGEAISKTSNRTINNKMKDRKNQLMIDTKDGGAESGGPTTSNPGSPSNLQKKKDSTAATPTSSP
ncbi:unnamed protein product, partial [Amoebophrya sp. A25]